MLPRLALLRLLLLAIVAGAVSLAPVAVHAQDEEDEEDEEEGGGDEEEGGGEEEEEDEEDALDKDQPPVTAGGLFVLETYPIAELERPLSMTKGIFEGRAGIAFDMSETVTFETVTLDVRGRYGLQDNFELQFNAAINVVESEKPEAFLPESLINVGMEVAMLYDVVDFRLALEVPTDFDYMSFVFGFPFKYRIKPQFAIVALERLFTINTDRKPDLEVSVGALIQPVKFLAVIVRGTFKLAAFDTSNGISLPATIAVQFSPVNRFDIGLQFQFDNLKPPEQPDDTIQPPDDDMDPDVASPFARRNLAVYLRGRF